MTDREKLEKMDLLRARFHVSYDEARQVLESFNWDVVEATVHLGAKRKDGGSEFVEQLKVTGSDLIETIKRLLHQGDITRIIIRDQAGAELFNLPVNGVLAITVLIPVLTALGAVIVVAKDYTVEVVRRGE